MAQKSGLVADFKKFIMTGNLVNMAVAFIMGGAVAAVVGSFIKNIVMGIISLLLPKKYTDFSDLKIGKSVLIGQFLNDLVGFVSIALVVFLLVRAYTRMTEKTVGETGASEVGLLTEIRDLLKK